MEAIIFFVLLVLLVLLLTSRGSGKWETSAADRARHREDKDSHIYYYNAENELVHESKSCSDCMADYAVQLESNGVHVEQVVLGRRRSGDLKW
jgi:uncharacterized membrane protein